MPIDTFWLNKARTILHRKFRGYWLLEDLFEVMKHPHDTVSDHLDIILDFEDSKTSFLEVYNNTAIADYQNFERLRDPRVRLVILVGTNPFITLSLRMAERIAPDAVRGIFFADSLEEALVQINRHQQIAEGMVESGI